MKLIMNGALGRMGRSIIKLVATDPEIELSGAVEIESDNIGRDIGDILGIGSIGVPLVKELFTVIKEADVVVDFSWADTVLKTASLCADTKTPLVVGTTGLTKEENKKFKSLVSPIACVMAPNMCIGINLLFKLVAEAASILGDEYDIEITEVHHRFKKDAPSGTAQRLAEIISEILNIDLEKNAVYGRKGIVGERTRREIGIHSLRIGDVVGEHTVSFGTIGERLELVHKAQSRDAFAQGALKATKFVYAAEPGLYDMQDVLNLK